MASFLQGRSVFARWGVGLASTALSLGAVFGVLLAAPYEPVASSRPVVKKPSPQAVVAERPRPRAAPSAVSRPPAQPPAPRLMSSAEMLAQAPDPAPRGAEPPAFPPRQAAAGAPVAFAPREERLAADAAPDRTSLAPSMAPVPTLRKPVAPVPEAAPPAEAVAPPPPPPPPQKKRKPAPIRPLAGAKEGAICDDPLIIGVPLQAIADEGGCAIASPVRVKSVAGVAITPRAVGGCGVPRKLAGWIESELQPAAEALLGSRVKKIHQVSAYVCRNRYNASQGKLSFHATGDALDIAAFELADGRRIRVLEDWRSEIPEPVPVAAPAQPPGAAPGVAPTPASAPDPEVAARAAFLQRVWKTACGPFGTVLGPGANAAHKDHFHFDVAQRRNAFCE